jgi:hypothetical protein
MLPGERPHDSRRLSVSATLGADLGENLAIDASDLPAYANGQRFLSKNGAERERFSDRDASWDTARLSRLGRAVASTGTASTPPWTPRRAFRIAWRVASARVHESTTVAPLLDLLVESHRGFFATEPVGESGTQKSLAPAPPTRRCQ